MKKDSTKIKVTKKELFGLYINQKLPLDKIGKILNVCQGTVFNYLNKFNIKRRVESLCKRNLSGKTNGDILVLDKWKREGRAKAIKWKCKCLLCNKKLWIWAKCLKKNGSERCVECANRLRSKNIGYGRIPDSYWNIVVKGAELRKIPINITSKYAWNIFIKQDYKCKLSNIPLIMGTKSKMTASLDRIDNTKGYVKDNIQWVHKAINMIKGALKEEDFIDYCLAISQNQIKNGIIVEDRIKDLIDNKINNIVYNRKNIKALKVKSNDI